MTISLPDSLKEFVDQQVANGHYPNAQAYLEALVEADFKREAMAQIEPMILEGLDSGPASDMTHEDWELIRREGLARMRSTKNT